MSGAVDDEPDDDTQDQVGKRRPIGHTYSRLGLNPRNSRPGGDGIKPLGHFIGDVGAEPEEKDTYGEERGR